jgi:hypothetical protein
MKAAVGAQLAADGRIAFSRVRQDQFEVVVRLGGVSADACAPTEPDVEPDTGVDAGAEVEDDAGPCGCPWAARATAVTAAPTARAM